MPVLLPPIIALRNGRSRGYLTYDNGNLTWNGLHVFADQEKIEVVASSTGLGLVHLRCLQNNKFICVKYYGEDLSLSPDADKPEEDQSKQSCTLFEPQRPDVVADNLHVQLMHVNTKLYATTSDRGLWMLQRSRKAADADIYEITNLESLVMLPRYVAFKAMNGKYLQWAEGNQLSFTSTDKGSHNSAFEVITDGHGVIKIKVFDDSTNNYLSRKTQGDKKGVIFCDSSSTPPSEFWPVKIDDRTVALKWLEKNNKEGRSGKFCTLQTRNIPDALYADDTSLSISNIARFEVEELVLSRRIYNTHYDLKNAKIYGDTPVTMATGSASNSTSEANTVEFKFSYRDSQSSKWTANVSWKGGVQAKVEAKVPFFGGGEVTTSTEFSASYEWGKEFISENFC